jgi:Flp pilus assembly protein TadG
MTRATTANWWRPRARSGQALVEFTLAMLFLFLPIVLGTIELGRGVFYYHQISHMAREGARWLIVTDQDGSNSFLQPGNAPNATNTYTTANCGGCNSTAFHWVIAQANGLASDDLTVIIERDPLPPGFYRHGLPVAVEVRYAYRPVVSEFLGLPVTIPLRARSSMLLA